MREKKSDSDYCCFSADHRSYSGVLGVSIGNRCLRDAQNFMQGRCGVLGVFARCRHDARLLDNSMGRLCEAGRQAQPLKLIPLPNSHRPSDNDGCGNPPRAGKLSAMKFVLTFFASHVIAPLPTGRNGTLSFTQYGTTTRRRPNLSMAAFMPPRFTRPRSATRHKLGIQRYKGRAGSQIATLLERAA